MTALNGERRRSRFSRSPRPIPSDVPPVMANGTSDPSSNANLTRRSRESLLPWSASIAAIAAAASALPPPSPAWAGMRLMSVKLAPPPSASARATSRAARSTILPEPPGTRAALRRVRVPREAACSWRTDSVKPRGRRRAVSVSASVTDWNTVTRSWNPSARLGPTASPRFSLARASTVTTRGAARYALAIARAARGRAVVAPPAARLRARLTARGTAPSTPSRCRSGCRAG